MTEAAKITVYGTNWCPACRVAKRVFNQCEIDFEWINIDKDTAARAYVEEVNNGYRSVPTIIFPDGDILVEPTSRVGCWVLAVPPNHKNPLFFTSRWK